MEGFGVSADRESSERKVRGTNKDNGNRHHGQLTTDN